jgi:hypothetical protein
MVFASRADENIDQYTVSRDGLSVSQQVAPFIEGSYQVPLPLSMENLDYHRRRGKSQMRRIRDLRNPLIAHRYRNCGREFERAAQFK